MATIIAEIGHNHNGNLRLAKSMICEAKECGADIAKFQLYDITKIKKPWQSRYFELMAAQLTRGDWEELSEEANSIGIEIMASCFDAERVDWVEDAEVKRHKVASRSINDALLWKALLATKKPIIASLGMWPANTPLPNYKADFLYCISDYPAEIKKLPLFSPASYTGFSDHSIGLNWAKTAIDQGATIIEKHFTLHKDLPGYNQAGSMNPTELKELVKYAKQ